ncbi:MAG: hypothetical protein AAGC55_10660, partial [Myxococcota bacterium]
MMARYDGMAILAQAVRRGIEVHLASCPAARSPSGACTCASENLEVEDADGEATKPRTSQTPAPKRRGEMNKTEQRYVTEVLDPAVDAGDIRSYGYETHKLLIASKTDAPGSRSTYYTPDFVVYRSDGGIEFHEVKGYYGTKRAHRSGK